MEVCPAFIDETGILSGTPQNQPVYGIGVLIVPETKSITDAFYRLHFNFSAARQAERRNLLRDIRGRGSVPQLDELDLLLRSTRHHEYKFTEVTRSNLQQYIDLLNLYFSFAEPQFHAVLLDRLDPGYNPARWKGDAWSAYAQLTHNLLQQCLDREIFAIVDLQGKPNKSPVHLEDALCSLALVKGCLRATSDMSVYLQLVDVLLGCIQFDWKDARDYYSDTSRRAADKRELVNFVKGALGMSPAERFLPGAENSRHWNRPSSFAIYRGEWPGG